MSDEKRMQRQDVTENQTEVLSKLLRDQKSLSTKVDGMVYSMENTTASLERTAASLERSAACLKNITLTLEKTAALLEKTEASIWEINENLAQAESYSLRALELQKSKYRLEKIDQDSPDHSAYSQEPPAKRRRSETPQTNQSIIKKSKVEELPEIEEPSAFYRALIHAMPEVGEAAWLRKQAQLKERNRQEPKNLPRQFEAESESEGKEEKRVQTHEKGIKIDKCHRCNQEGHWAIHCPLKEKDLWYCYYCTSVQKHKGTDCPNAIPRPIRASRGRNTIPRGNSHLNRYPRSTNQSKREHRSGNDQRDW